MEHIERIGYKAWNQAHIEYYDSNLGIKVEDIPYKIVYGEEQTVQVEGKDYTLFPISNINPSIQTLIDDRNQGKMSYTRGNSSLSAVKRIITEKLTPTIIPEANIDRIMSSYIKHYHDTLGEVWSEEDFINKLESLKYRTYKYARDEQTGEIIVVGFFGVQISTAAGGKYLTNGELYVLPEFRGKGIATELVKQTLELGKEDGIEGFDSLTYSVPGHNSLQFWKNIGAENTELYHIAGDINEMISNIKEQTSDDSKKVL